jgi:1,4-alpha-glucan branching enzyme
MAVNKKSSTEKIKEGALPATVIADKHFSLFTDYDIQLFREGRHFQLFNKFGSHLVNGAGGAGAYFAVWAPNARYMSVTGSFNNWDKYSHPMYARWDGSGIWELFIAEVEQGALYKYYLESHNGYSVAKADPYAIHCEVPPGTASIVWDRSFKWTDKKWMKERGVGKWYEKSLSIYEMHAGSWKRVVEDGNRFMTYRELAKELPRYCTEMGFSHVEFLPLTEHPFYGSWGYQVTGYFAPTSRYGTPQDFMYLVNELHCAGVGVILDWVPSHFPDDEYGLCYFDGTHLYEHADPRKGFHPDWNSYIFNYARNEVREFLISSALYWLDKFHIDGLRVDAVASMLYLDYSRRQGEWVPNEYGGHENLEAIAFLKEFNYVVHTNHNDVITIAEESTAWPGVTHSTESGGLGFDLKWMMGWMYDTLQYFQQDPIYRKYSHGQLSFSIFYAFAERFVLPLSHDEVVYGKRSLINKMPGDEWQQFANLRLLYSYMYGHPGGKLLFMGCEFAQRHEWQHDFSLDWHEAELPLHKGVQLLLKDLNDCYKKEPALHDNGYSPDGFEWIDFNDATNSVISWVRKSKNSEQLIFVFNFTPVVRENYRIGVPALGYYKEVFNSDNEKYGGSNVLNDEVLETAPIARHGRSHSLSLLLPPLATIVLKWTGSNL